MRAVDGLKWWPLGRNTVGESWRRSGISGCTIGIKKLGRLLVASRAVAHGCDPSV